MIGIKKHIPTKENPQRLFGARYIPKCLDQKPSQLIHSHGAFLPQRGKTHVNRADFRVEGGDFHVINLTYHVFTCPQINKGGRSREIPANTGGYR